jgi:hypothetical protein
VLGRDIDEERMIDNVGGVEEDEDKPKRDLVDQRENSSIV